MWRHRFPRRPSSVQVAMQMWVEVSLVLNWLLLICTLMRLNEGLWGSHDGSIRGSSSSSSSRHLDFLSCWIWKLKVNLISLVKLQGLSGVLLLQRERVFRWMFQINISVFSLRHPGRRKETQAVFSFRGPVDFTKAPCCAPTENRCSNGVWSMSAGRLFFFQSDQRWDPWGGLPVAVSEVESVKCEGTNQYCGEFTGWLLSCPAWIVTLI